MRRTFFRSVLAAAAVLTLLSSLANAAPPNSMFRQSSMANQSAFLANQHQAMMNRQTIDQQLIANAQRNVSNLDRGLLNRSIQRNREAPLAQINRSQAFMGISNAARLNQTAMSAQANSLGIPALSSTFGAVPSNRFFNPSSYASMYGLSFNGTMGSSAITGMPMSSSGLASPLP